MPESDQKPVIQARTLPLGELQRALQRTGEDALTGAPEDILRALPPGHGGVVRLPRESTADILAVRNAFRNAAARLRPDNSDRGLLATAAREEGPLVAIYFWYTGDPTESPETHAVISPPTEPSTLFHSAPSALSTLVNIEPVPEQGPAAPAPEWSLPDAAKALNVSVKTIRRAIKAGRLPARLMPGPRGPEYRVDLRPMLEANVQSGVPVPPTSFLPTVSPSAQRTSPARPLPEGTLESTLQHLLERLDSLESEVGKLRKGD